MTKNLPITHLLITHAHADHYGGAAYLVKQYGVKVIAPTFERAIIENPILEPTYLFSGNDPLDELRNKFLEGPEVKVDIEIEEGYQKVDKFEFEAIATPGHSYHQLAINIYDTLYAADSYFGKEEIKKHKIPYITSVDKAVKSLEKLKTVQVKGAVPGHGPYEQQFVETIEANIDYHQMLLEKVYGEIAEKPTVSHEEIVARMCTMMKVKSDLLGPFLLFRTAVTAYITALINEDRIEHYIKDFRWIFKVKEEGS
ncbi:MBL fold metallo-hydrolase [Piscibacillus salipiscarius]|uniref:MBL fold metallo-hydrolase n=1 Tax=Piscibacillus salipiscarius TaxID=299480 RepID=UPI000A54131D|nr:MBL fold metallo-hydrolase [Piscibacillus salipiscarius]